MSKLKCFAGLVHGLSFKCHIKAYLLGVAPSWGTPKFFSDWLPEEKITHTGQCWDENDYRLARFVDRPKHVNPNIAIDLIEEVPPTICSTPVVACDGGGGPTGHPKVYINLEKPGSHICGYCGLRFELDREHH